MIQDTEELYELIKECKIRRLTTQESLDYIKQNGIKLSERTFRRYKKEWEDKIQERIFEEGERVFDSEFIRRLDTIKQVEKESWILFSRTENDLLKVRLLRFISDFQEKSKNCFHDIRWRGRTIKEEIKKEEKEREREENRRLSEEEEITT